MDYILEPALDVPGLEGIWEFNGLRLNDLSALERIRFTGVGGLQDDSDLRDNREPNFDRAGEHAGIQQAGGRTITAEGVIEAGSIPSVRRAWRDVKKAFDSEERDLVIHVPKEVPVRYNEIQSVPINSSIDLQWWFSQGTNLTLAQDAVVIDGLRAVINTSASNTGGLAGVLNEIYGGVDALGIPWNGEDIFASARIKIQSAAATATSLSAIVYFFDDLGAPRTLSTAIGSTTVWTQAAPVTGTLYEGSIRIAASAVPVGTTKIILVLSLVNPATNGAYSFRSFDPIIVMLAQADATPTGAFDGDSPNFAWEGMRTYSRSYGPVNQVNGIPDVTTADIQNLAGAPTLWGNGSAAGATVNVAPKPVRNPGIAGVDRGMYMKVTNPDATPRLIAIKPDTTTNAVPMRVHPGRTYRAAYSVKIIQSATKVAQIEIVWVDLAGSTLSTSLIAGSASVAEQRLTVAAVAPARVVGAYARVSFAATGSGQVFEWVIAKPFLIDITDYDPGANAEFSEVGGENPYVAQIKNASGVPAGSVRRIPRPWLVQQVRKSDKVQSPEKQTDYRSRRDFMLSLRASDPRIYSVDEQSEWTSMAGTAAGYESAQPTVGAAPTSLPLGLSSGNHIWTQVVNTDPTNLLLYQGPDGSLRLRTASLVANGSRIFRSQSGPVPTIPYIIIRGNPAMVSDNPLKDSTLTVLIKWINNTNYLAVDWTSTALAPNTLRIYKVVAGVPTTLASTTFNTRLYPPNTWIVCSLVSPQLVTASVYDTYPDPSLDVISPDPLINVATTLAGGDATSFGTAVAGNMGFGMTASFPDSPLPQHAGILQYEGASGVTNARGTLMNIPVIGDFDEIPFRLQFSSFISYPTIILTTPDGATRSMLFTGQYGNSLGAQATLDFSNNYFRDQNGLDLWGTVLPFYDHLVLQPGINRVRAMATNWSSGLHVGISWRDAVK